MAKLIEIKGKIQGDGRKFLHRFVLKVILGRKVSSQSLNEVHIYRLQPKSAILSLIVSSQRHGLQMANEADEVLLGKRPR